MKKFMPILLLFLLLPPIAFSQPWQNGTSGAIYYTGGVVGIGKSNPTYTLDVNGVVNTNSLYFNGSPAFLSGSGAIYTVMGTNLAIGTSSPLGRIHSHTFSGNTSYGSQGVFDVGLHIQNATATTNNFSVISFAGSSGTPATQIGTTYTNHTTNLGKLFFSTRPSGGSLIQRMTIDETGKVGINTSTPAYQLDVAGSVNATGLLINGVPITGGSSQWVTSGSSIYYNTGNVGLGKTVPGYKLDVNGIVNATGLYVNGVPFNGSPWVVSGSNLNFTSGSVSLGTTTAPSGYHLAVGGRIIAEEVVIKLEENWPDYVFLDDYDLPTLNELDQQIKAHGHLPGIPSAAEIKNNGVVLGEMNAALLEKIEELTLYMIEADQTITALKEKLTVLEQMVSTLAKESTQK